MKFYLNIISTALQTFLFILLPFFVFTLITSKTPITGIQSFVVLSGSMSPKFPTGSIVYAKSVSTYSKYDVITFKNKSGQIVTHRITKILKDNSKFVYQTKGDANNVMDKAFVPQEDVLGKIVFFVPHIGYIAGFFKTPLGMSAFIIFPATMFIVFELWQIKKEIEKQTEKRV
ncbi:MAG: signal peptidase I, partial [Candidatus Levybacteria bacterium]|nr:signal peptidase I [Candidatus Levybacteria bacterium]